MTFLVRPGAPLYQAQLQARALDTWRDAELVVQRRWDDLPRGGPCVAPVARSTPSWPRSTPRPRRPASSPTLHLADAA